MLPLLSTRFPFFAVELGSHCFQVTGRVVLLIRDRNNERTCHYKVGFITFCIPIVKLEKNECEVLKIPEQFIVTVI